MSHCGRCLELINHGDFCRPVSRNYHTWYLFREAFCDRAFIYGSLLFHSLNNVKSHALQPSTCKHHAKERIRLLNHFAFLADPCYSQENNFFLSKNIQKSVGYILRRNVKSQSFTLYHDSAFEERIAEVSCGIILLVGDEFKYTYQDVLIAHIPNMSEGYVMARLSITQNVDFALPVLVTNKPFDYSSEIANAYSKIWSLAYRNQPILEEFTRLTSNCFHDLNTSYRQSESYVEGQEHDSKRFYSYLLHQLGSIDLDNLQRQLNYLLPGTEDKITIESTIDISQPAAQLHSPILSLPSIQLLLKIVYLRRNITALRNNSEHGSLFMAVCQSFSRYFTDVPDNCPVFVMNNFDVSLYSQ